jgi:hypothetical protein
VYVLVIHRLRDAVMFRRVEARRHARPAELRLVHALPARQRDVCVCLWEAPSVEAVRGYTVAVYGRSSDVQCFEVDDAEALGLPPFRLPGLQARVHLGK